MSYLKWFLANGWKNYIFPFVILLFIDFCIYRSWFELIDSPVALCVFVIPTTLSAHIGLIYHSILIWKKNR